MNKNRKMKKYVMLFTLSILLLSGVGSAATIDMGKQIFDANCGFCHTGHPPTGASDAQSINALAEDAKLREASIGEIVRNGTKDGMPAFNKSDISDIDISYLVDYLKNVPNSFDSSGTTPTTTTNPISPIIPKNPGATPVGTSKIEPLPATTPKSPGFEAIFLGLGIIIAYTIRRNYRL
jgi:cytochrome c5